MDYKTLLLCLLIPVAMAGRGNRGNKNRNRGNRFSQSEELEQLYNLPQGDEPRVENSKLKMEKPKLKQSKGKGKYNDIVTQDGVELTDQSQLSENSGNSISQTTLLLLSEMGEQIKAMRRQMGTIKFQNHVMYRQMKEMSEECKEKPVYGIQSAIQQTEPAKPTCPEDYTWNESTQSCYMFSSKRITWRMARERCMAEGADLVSIETSREQRFITDYATNRPDIRHCDFWTGLTDEGSEGKWYWINTQQHATYTNWNLNEPNNAGGNEHCMHMMWVFSWAWNDARCNYGNACYICEIHHG